MRRALRLSHVFLLCAALAAVAFFSVGCGSSSSKSSSATTIRFVNASPDETTVNILIDSKVVTSGLTNGGGFTAYLPVASGARRIQIQDPVTAVNLIDTTPSISGPTTYIIYNYANTPPMPAIAPLILTDDNTAPASGMFKIRLINLAPSLNHSVDGYVVLSTTTTLMNVMPTASALPFPPAATATYYPLTAGSWETIFTPVGAQSPFYSQPTAATFASGEIATVLLLEAGKGNYSEATLVDVQ